MAQIEDAEYLGLVVEAAPVAIITVDDSGRIMLVNAQAESLFGYQRDELLGQRIEMLVPVRFHRGHPAQRSAFFSAPSARPMGAGRDLFALRKDGTEIPVEIGLNPIHTAHAQIVLATIIDMTERKLAEELRLQSARERRRLLDTEADLERALGASHVKSQFVATMSHELRTPLNAIIGMTELLAGTALDQRQRSFVGTISESAEALLAIINSILDFSKIEAGKIELESRDFSLEAIVEGTADVLAQQVRQKNLQLYTYIDSRIPRVLRGDADRLRQILLNLIGNAVKFTQRGRVVVRVCPVETHARATTLRFEIEDTGPGIDRDLMQRLFEPFVQADSSSARTHGGTGLGLSISKRLVELMGGEIGVVSEPEAGAMFWFTAHFALPAVVAATRRLNGVGAFVISDDEMFTQIVLDYLHAWGITSERVVSEADVERFVRGVEPDAIADWLVILDVDSRDSDEMRAALHAIETLPRVHTIPIGADQSLAKPLRQGALFDRLVEALEGEQRGAPSTTAVVPATPTRGDGALHVTRPVLVAEDNPNIQELLVHQFARLGVPVRIVSDGAKAVAALSGESFACIFMDCHMPDVDGYAATRLIREAESKGSSRVPIIAMTANAFKEDREACLAAGMDDHLSKPVRLEDLRKMLERWASAAGVPDE